VYYNDICQELVGYEFCGQQNASEDGEDDVLYDWEIRELEKTIIVEWYRIDKNQDEQASEADFRGARGG
jgi:hypothetical protein